MNRGVTRTWRPIGERHRSAGPARPLVRLMAEQQPGGPQSQFLRALSSGVATLQQGGWSSRAPAAAAAAAPTPLGTQVRAERQKAATAVMRLRRAAHASHGNFVGGCPCTVCSWEPVMSKARLSRRAALKLSMARHPAAGLQVLAPLQAQGRRQMWIVRSKARMTQKRLRARRRWLGGGPWEGQRAAAARAKAAERWHRAGLGNAGQAQRRHRGEREQAGKERAGRWPAAAVPPGPHLRSTPIWCTWTSRRHGASWPTGR